MRLGHVGEAVGVLEQRGLAHPRVAGQREGQRVGDEALPYPAKATALGATVARSLSQKVDILLAGQKAGSKLDEARALGVEVRDEAWLTALRDGGPIPEATPAPAPSPIEGRPGAHRSTAPSTCPRKVMGRASGFIQASFGDIPNDLERSVAGETWRGDALERALRVFDYPDDYGPAAFVMKEGAADPRVVLADDHSNWASGRHAAFEAYMEHVLGTLGTIRARMDWFAGPPSEEAGPPERTSLDTLLPHSVTLAPAEDGATFEVEVVSVEGAGSGGVDPRLAIIEKTIPGHRYRNVAKVPSRGRAGSRSVSVSARTPYPRASCRWATSAFATSASCARGSASGRPPR